MLNFQTQFRLQIYHQKGTCIFNSNNLHHEGLHVNNEKGIYYLVFNFN